MMRRFVFLAVLFGLLLSGCVENASTTTTDASVTYCRSLGYTVKLAESELGQYAICVFPDGSECETWSFYAGRCGENFNFCAKYGGVLEVANSDESAPRAYSVCILPNGTRYAIKDYLREETDYYEIQKRIVVT